LPAEKVPGVNIVPYIKVIEMDNGIIVDIGDNGDGTSLLSKKLRDLAQRTLSHHGCSSWTFEEYTYDPEKYL